MKKTKETAIRDITEFDDVSLWQLLPTTTGSGLKTLKHIVDAELNCQIDRGLKPLSLLITGPTAKRTHARAFLRALGIESINEIPANLLNGSQSMIDLFHALIPDNGYVITDAQYLREAVKLDLFHIITTGKFQCYSYAKQCKVTYPVYGTIIMTAESKEKVPEALFRNIEYHVDLGEYSEEQLMLLTLQRIKYANLTYESEEILNCIVDGCEDLEHIVRFLKLCSVLLRAQNDNMITKQIVSMATKLH